MNNLLKKITFVLFFTFMLFALQSSAQCVVYSFKGNIFANGKPVKVGIQLLNSTILTIQKDSRIIILSERERKLYTYNKIGKISLKDLIASKEKSTQELNDSYLAFIKNKIKDVDIKQDKNYMQTAGNAFRETDTLLIDILVPEESDSLSNCIK